VTVTLWRVAADTPNGPPRTWQARARPPRVRDGITPASTWPTLQCRSHWPRGRLARILARAPTTLEPIPRAHRRAGGCLGGKTNHGSTALVGWDAIPEDSRLVPRDLPAEGEPDALLAVPSAIIYEEDNVLINPAHPDARRISATRVRRFVYDPRV